METKFNLEESLEKFKRLFVNSIPEYAIGQQQKQNYKDHLRESGERDIGVRGINSFGIELIRRPVYFKGEKKTYDGMGRPQYYETNLALAPNMEADSKITLQMDKDYKPYSIQNPVPWDDNVLEKEIMSLVEKIFLMTNEEVMRFFSVNYSFSPEMSARFQEEDEQIKHSHVVQQLKKSLEERRQLENITATPTQDEPVARQPIERDPR